jgi:hypothetical protein
MLITRLFKPTFNIIAIYEVVHSLCQARRCFSRVLQF